MQSQDYHYNMRKWDSYENIKRNLATGWGKPSSPYSGMISTPMGPMPIYKTFIAFRINIKY